MLVRNVIRATGEERWLLHKATPPFDADGSLSLIVSVVEDLTKVKRAELAQQPLAEVGKGLSSSLGYRQTLQQLAELTIPRLADWCGVVMRGEGVGLRQVTRPLTPIRTARSRSPTPTRTARARPSTPTRAARS